MLRKTTDWELVDEGELEEDVYDIETGNHMFFGNDILLHNSFYIDVTDIYKHEGKIDDSIEEKIKFGNEVCEKITENSIKPHLNKVTDEFNTFGNNLDMKREVICVGNPKTGNCGFWCGKKHYVLLVNDSEGYTYDIPHMKIMGMSMIQSSTPEYFRLKQQEAARMLVEDGPENVRKFVKETYKEFLNLKPEEIAMPRGVSSVGEYVIAEGSNEVKLGTPIQSRASIYFNNLLKKHKIDGIQPIQDHDKIKFVYLKENPEHIDVIAFKDKLPKEFGLHKYVDYDTMFQKSFKKPMEDIFKSCGLELEETFDIDDLFS